MRGGVIIHMLLIGYISAMIAVVCDDYFIPSLDIISASKYVSSLKEENMPISSDWVSIIDVYMQ